MSEHVVSRKSYFAVFAALLVLTFVTVEVAYVDLGYLNTVVALGIACIKATLVTFFFMHLRHSPKLIWLILGGSVAWLGVLIIITFSDYASRGMLPFPGK